MKLTIPECTKYVYKVIGNNLKEGKTQDPDRIVITKQWSETGTFKGYWIDVEYKSRKGKKFDLIISFDIK
ncbi:MAG: hypothetical protein M0R17_04940, partial [Candidatus Omnitrophica bacterium]|nr:hypothetical protein [Candidatus Omnitrophota bacterium]